MNIDFDIEERYTLLTIMIDLLVDMQSSKDDYSDLEFLKIQKIIDKLTPRSY